MEILLLLSGLIFIFIIVEYNTFTRLKNRLKNSQSTIDVYLTQRFDLIPNLVQCVKGYASYEKETLQRMIELRELYSQTKNLEVGQDLTNKMNSLVARAEDMAELKASEQFHMLQKSLIKIESQLQAARRIYNGDVTLYNTTIQTFPNNIVASFLNMKSVELFTIDEYKAQNIEVEV